MGIKRMAKSGNVAADAVRRRGPGLKAGQTGELDALDRLLRARAEQVADEGRGER